MDHNSHDYSKVAVAATLHCLTGCAIGEITGMVIGNIANLPNVHSIGLSTLLAFIFGYTLSLMPLLKHGIPMKQAMTTVLAADTLSILAMEVADNAIMAIVPGAMSANLVNPIFWATLPLSLAVGFVVALPVNQYLLSKGKGHALVHQSMHHE